MKPCRLQLRLKTPADTVLRQVTRMGSLSGATGPGFSSLVAMSRLGPKGPRDTSVESTMGTGGAGEPGFLKSESECVLDFRYCRSLLPMGVYWLYLGGVYPVCKSEASSHRSAGRPHKNIDREGAREGGFLSRISTNKKASSAIQNDVGSERNGVKLFLLLRGVLSFH